MKTRFAKFVDNTLGCLMLFTAVTACLLYFLPTDLAVFGAFSITSTAFVILKTRQRKKIGEQSVSKAARNMFFDFMFESDALPPKLLLNGLKARGKDAKIRGKAVYVGGVCAYCDFSDAAITPEKIARRIGIAKHYGAKKLLLLLRVPPVETVEIADFEVQAICGEDVYKLFGSLNALPDGKYAKKQRKRFARLGGALGKDRIPRYAVLSALLIALTVMTDMSVVTLVCAVISSALLIASIVFTLISALRRGGVGATRVSP